jgi:hypothetical protein
MCSLFLHHLADDDARTLLARMRDAAAQMVAVSDLRRSKWGYALAWLGSRVVSRSEIVRTDGPLSVRAAFTIGEARALAYAAGLDGAKVRPIWPQRFLLVWNRPGAEATDSGASEE